MTIVFFQRHPREKIVRESTKRYSLSINCYAAASKMSYYRRSRCSRSPSPYKRYSRSVSRSLSSDSSDVENPGNNLYVTGISARVTKRDLEKHFSAEGKVEDVHLVVDPWTRESRGFGFVTMSSFEEAERCIKYLDRSVLEGRVITVEKARRRRGRTPTPGRYLGLRTAHARRRSPSCSPYSRSRSPRYSSERDGSHSRSYSRYYRRRRRSCSPYYRSYSHGRSYSRSRSPYSRQDRSYSPYYYREYGPDDRYYSRGRYRDYYSPDDRYYRRGRYRSVTPRYRRYSRSYSHSVSSRSVSPRYSRRDYSPSVSQSPMRRSSRKGLKRSASRGSESGKRAPSRASRRHSWSPSVSFSSRSG